MIAGAYVARRGRSRATLSLASGDHEHALALNDVFVNRGAVGGMIDCAVTIDGRFVYAMRADGLIVATPTGSTAYALSAQGPIVDPGVAAFLLVPVAPHALTNRPIAVRDSVVIEIALLRGKNAGLHCDGQANFALSEGDPRRRPPRRARVRCAAPEGSRPLRHVAAQAHWSETPEICPAAIDSAGTVVFASIAQSRLVSRVGDDFPARFERRRKKVVSELLMLRLLSIRTSPSSRRSRSSSSRVSPC